MNLLTPLIASAIILLITAIAAHFGRRLMRRLLARDSSHLPQSTIFVNIVRGVVWFLGISVMLSSCFNVDVSALVTALGVGGIALSLGFQDTISNLIGGLQLSVMNVIQPGDIIETANLRGRVRDVTWRQTTLVAGDKSIVVIPNSVLNKASFVQVPKVQKILVPINVSKKDVDIEAFSECALHMLKERLAQEECVEGDVLVLLDSSTEYGYGGNVVVWVNDDDQVSHVKDVVIRTVVAATQKVSQPATEGR